MFEEGHLSFDTHLRRLHKIGQGGTLRIESKERGDERKKKNRKSKDEKIVQAYGDLGCDFEGEQTALFL